MATDPLNVKPANPSADWQAAYNAAIARGNVAVNAVRNANLATNNNTAAITNTNYLWTPTSSSGGGKVTIPSGEKPEAGPDPAVQQQLDELAKQQAALLAQQQAQQAAAAAAAEAAKRNIAAQLQDLFNSYDLGSLAPEITRMIQQNMGADEITLALQQTAAYKQRFAANEVRKAKGMAVLSPAEYISTERAYRQLMQASGLPIGFYDSNTDFQKFLENDVSPTELQQRVQAASEAVYNAPAGTLDVFHQWYSTGDLIAYALDPSVAEPLIEKRLKAAEAAATGRGQGLNVTQATAEQLGGMGLSLGQLLNGMGTAGADQPNVNKLNQIYQTAVTDDDLVKSTFMNDAEATQKIKKLASQERATFGGTGGTTGAGLSKNAGGRL